MMFQGRMKCIMIAYTIAVSTALALTARSHNNNGIVAARSSLSASYMSTSSSQSFSDIKPPAQMYVLFSTCNELIDVHY